MNSCYVFVCSVTSCEMLRGLHAYIGAQTVSFSYTSSKMCECVLRKRGHSVGLCEYFFCISFFVRVQRLIMCWVKDLEDSDIKLLCPNFVTDSGWLRNPVQPVIPLIQNTIPLFFLFYETKKSISFIFISLLLELSHKCLTSFHIQRHKTILQRTFTTKEVDSQPEMLSPHPPDGRFNYKPHAI